MKQPQSPHTEADLLTMLERHYLPENRYPSGLFASEVQSPCGARRADALWLPLTVAGGSDLVGHELKTSRADLINELTDPVKSEPWAKYCAQWWLVVSDPKLIDGLTIPETWGILAPPSGRLRRTMTTIRPAPRLTPVHPAPAFRRLLAWQLEYYRQRMHTAEYRANNLQRELDQYKNRPTSPNHPRSSPRPNPEAERLGRLIQEAERKQRAAGSPWFFQLSDQQLIDIMADISTSQHAAEIARQSAATLIASCEQTYEPFSSAKERMRVALKLAVDTFDHTMDQQNVGKDMKPETTQ